MLDFFIFDLEATCWSEQHHLLQQEIIEIGAFHVNPYGEVLDSFSSFVRPVIHPYLSPFCQQLTSISQEDVDQAPTFDRVYKKFVDWMEYSATSSDYRLASWGSMDLDLLLDDCSHHQLHLDWEDDYMDLKKIYNRYKGNSKPFGLKKSLRKEKIEFKGIEHRAIDDAYNLTQLFIKYIDIWMS